MPNRHLKCNFPKIRRLIFPHKLAASQSISTASFQLLRPRPRTLDLSLTHLCVSPSTPPPNGKSCQLCLQKTHQDLLPLLNNSTAHTKPKLPSCFIFIIAVFPFIQTIVYSAVGGILLELKSDNITPLLSPSMAAISLRQKPESLQSMSYKI